MMNTAVVCRCSAGGRTHPQLVSYLQNVWLCSWWEL